MLRNYLVILVIFIWIFIAIFWIYPLKRKLQKKHGFDKGNDYFLEIAKRNDPLAMLVKKRTIIMFAVGFIGGVVMAFTK